MIARMMTCVSLLAVSLSSGWDLWAQSTGIQSVKPVHGIRTREKTAHAAAPASSTIQGSVSNGEAPQTCPQAGTGRNGIQYWGGPVLNEPTGVNIYFIWYGDWSGNPGARQVLTDLVKRIGGSPYFNINTTYYDCDNEGTNDPVFNKVNYVASVDDHYSMGSYLSDFDVDQLVASWLLPPFSADTNAVFFVLTSPDVGQQESAGNGGPFCAWHNAATVTFSPNLGPPFYDIKVAWIGDPHNFFFGCGVQDPSPNNNPDADSMTTFVAHELEESVTDPDSNGWYDNNGNENADKCVWTFGAYTFLPNGSAYNMKLGNRPYLIQQNWVNAKGGYCALRWDGE
jgi:hypothetical protein